MAALPPKKRYGAAAKEDSQIPKEKKENKKGKKCDKKDKKDKKEKKQKRNKTIMRTVPAQSTSDLT